MPPDPSKELRLLLAFFGEGTLPRCSTIDAEDLPQPARRLLDHNGHMTTTIETHYQSPVDVRPYLVRREGDLYGRKLDLLSASDGEVVMTGIMLINLRFATPEVRALILAETAPLGRILIEHGVLREVSITSFLRIEADDPLAQRFGTPSRPVHGRLATIFCDHVPAVDLLEIVSPRAPHHQR